MKYTDLIRNIFNGILLLRSRGLTVVLAEVTGPREVRNKSNNAGSSSFSIVVVVKITKRFFLSSYYVISSVTRCLNYLFNIWPFPTYGKINQSQFFGPYRFNILPKRK